MVEIDPVDLRTQLGATSVERLEGIGVRHIYETDPYQQARLTELVAQALLDDTFSVVIARHPCMLKFMRSQRKKAGYLHKTVDIDQQECRRIHECVQEFGCPTFQLGEEGRVDVNHDLCIGDGSCLQTCPAKAIKPPGRSAGIEKDETI